MENIIQTTNKHIKDYTAYNVWKRFFDIIFSGLFLLLFGWLIGILALLKFFEDGYNPFYVSERVGIKGKKIKFHKIRSMQPDADKLREQLINCGLNEMNGPAFKMENDPRVTKFGKFLRKTSLDELPQMWDVFCGRLSLVGPRSPIPEEVDHYTKSQWRRLDVKGGLVCLWQISPNRNSIDFDRWLALDLTYISNRSIWYDFKILMKAVWFVLTDHSGE